MRLTGLLWLLPAAAALSPPDTAFKPPPPPPDTSRLIDLLARSPDHQLLLGAFQRARLVPTLNRLNGSTLFAPTDDAIRRARDDERRQGLVGGDGGVWSAVVDWAEQGLLEVESSSNSTTEHDNLQLALRDTLLYHTLNFTLVPPPRSSNRTNATEPAPKPLPIDVVTLHETLYFPSLFPYNRSFPAPPSLPGTEPDEPDPDAPEDRPEGLLREEGQRVRVVRRRVEDKKTEGDEYWVGVDWRGEGGVRSAGKAQFARNGALVPLDGVLTRPSDLGAFDRALLGRNVLLTVPARSRHHPLDARTVDSRVAPPVARPRVPHDSSAPDPLCADQRGLVRSHGPRDALPALWPRRARPG